MKSNQPDNITKLEQQLDLNPENAFEVTGFIIAKHWQQFPRHFHWFSLVLETCERDYVFSSPPIFGKSGFSRHCSCKGPTSMSGLGAKIEAAIRGHEISDMEYVINNIRFQDGMDYELFIRGEKYD